MAYILAHAEGQLEFDRLIEAICHEYAGAEVTNLDYYATRIARQIEISEQRGMSIPNSPLECLERVSKEHGLQREMLIPIRPGLNLSGRLDRLGCLFSTERNADEMPTLNEVQSLIEILTQFGLRVETGGIGSA